MNAILVAVDYDDLLAITLPYNRGHFDRVMVVTAPCKDANDKADPSRTVEIARANRCDVFMTDLFWARGASFNKWAALEAGLDEMGRRGWICNMDADVLWPKDANLPPLEIGKLYGPVRRMYEKVDHEMDGRPYIPSEANWMRYPIHNNTGEWAGYTQIFHADDPHLGPPPWHEVDWAHAGAADSWFQAKWGGGGQRDYVPGTPQITDAKVRLPFEVLHIGEAGQNWHGRATPYLDGTVHPDAAARREACARIWRDRRGKVGEAKYAGEKLKEP